MSLNRTIDDGKVGFPVKKSKSIEPKNRSNKTIVKCEACGSNMIEYEFLDTGTSYRCLKCGNSTKDTSRQTIDTIYPFFTTTKNLFIQPSGAVSGSLFGIRINEAS